MELRSIIIALCSCLVGHIGSTNAQNRMPMIEESSIKFSTPTVSSMFQPIDCPVSYFNGTAEISIPLCDVEAAGIKLPISLSYASTGLKPSQEASWVGLGWNLSLNMSISRTIKCIDDFFEDDHWVGAKQFSYGYYNMPDAPFSQFFDNHFDEVMVSDVPGMHVLSSYIIPLLNRDIEPDIFYYSLFNGGGKFVFNNDTIMHRHDVLMTDKQRNMQVKVLELTDDFVTKHYFQLIDNDGTVYEFKKMEHEYDYSGDPAIDGRIDFGISYNTTDYKSSFTSSWFLTKIKTIQKDSIEFIYEDEFYYTPTLTTCTKYNEVKFLDHTVMGEFIHDSRILGEKTRYPWHKSLFKTAHLKQIRWKHGKIDFITSPRDDVFPGYGYSSEIGHAPYKLDRIVTYNSMNEIVNDFQFCYSYFSANGNDTYLTRRLRLDRIIDNIAPNHDFSINYYDGDFPSKETNAKDYWGYYNGISHSNDYYYGGLCHLNNKLYSGIDAKSKLETTKLGQIRSITYPTGESETFDYELNEFMMDSCYSTGGEFVGSHELYAVNYGSFVESNKSLSVSASMKLECIGQFQYVSNTTQQYTNTDLLLEVIDENTGQSMSGSQIYSTFGEHTPSYLKIERSFTLPQGNYRIVTHAPRYGWTGQWSIKCYNNTPVVNHKIPTHQSGAGLRIKSIVTGDKKREFSYPIGTLIIPPITNYNIAYSSHRNGEWSPTSTIYYVQNSEPTRPLASLSNSYVVGYGAVSEHNKDCTTTYNYGTIIPEQTMISDNYTETCPVFSNGLLREKIILSKDSVVMSQESIEYGAQTSTNINAAAMASNGHYEHFRDFNIDWFYPTSRNTMVDNCSVSEYYTYNNDLMIKSVNRASSGSNSTDSVSYSYEGSDSISLEMKNRNIIVPTESSKYINGNLASKTKMTYSAFGPMILPGKIENYDIDRNTYVGNTTYDRYDSHGNLLQMTHDGTPVSYIWSYNYKYPIAEISNLTYTEVENFVGSTNLTSIANANEPSAAQWNLVKNLQNSLWEHSLCSSMTIYIYKPLVGITSQIAPNGLVTCYEYDASGRLVRSYIKTATGTAQDLNKYYYNYKGTN